MKNLIAIGHALALGALASGAAGAPLISASGLDGAGLGFIPGQNGRAWGEMAFHTQDDITIVAPTLGVGFMPLPQLELSVVLPFSRISDDDDSETAFGNLYFAAQYVSVDGPLRGTVGLGVAAPTAPENGETANASEYGSLPLGLQHWMLRLPNTLGVETPFHLEGGSTFVGSLDGSLQLLVPTGDNSNSDPVLAASIAPGFGISPSDKAVFGVRLPMWIYVAGESDADDRTQTTVEPFARFTLGTQGFLGARFNVPVDEPLTQIDMWGLHIGGGARSKPP